MLVVMNRSAQGGLGNGTRSEYYDVEITDEGVKVLKHRQDLDGQLGLSLEDKTPPDLYLPLNQVVDATSPAGAPVSYTAMAHDWRQGPVPLKTSHDSGFTSLSAALGRLKFPFGNRENFDGVGPGVLRRAESGKALSISLTNKLLANAERIAAVIGS
jgi:hypothetical protein